jgi:hypothetical protein
MTASNTKINERKTPVEKQALVRQIMVALTGAFKKNLLYPSGHVIYQTALNQLKDKLAIFFQSHSQLVLAIDQNKIRFDKEVVHEGAKTEENPAFILFRDGIYALEFDASIDVDELHLFLNVLKQHQMVTEDGESDVVTALWELGLSSVHYQAEDVGFDGDEEFEIPDVGGFQTSEDLSTKGPAEDNDTISESFFQPSVHDWNLQEITAEDRAHLAGMITEEEEWERIEYVLYILLFILQQQTQPADFSEVITILKQELQEAMHDHKFKSVHNTIQILRKSLSPSQERTHWSIPILEDLFAFLSGEEFLKDLHADLDRIAACSSRELDYLKHALLFLNPSAVAFLCPMLQDTESKRLRKLLMVVIGIMGERDFQSFSDAMTSSEPDLMKMLVYVMGFMKNDRSLKRLVNLMRHNEANIRKEALRGAFRRNPDIAGEVVWLLEDPDTDVQKLYLRLAGKKRNPRTEKLLLDYLKKNRIRSGNKNRLLDVYIALGKCGSDDSLSFLKKELFFIPLFGLLRSKKSVRRQAAVHALNGLDTEKARLLLSGKLKINR